MSQKRVIAFFDFDGTLTSSDSFFHFLRFANSKRKFLIGSIWLSPLLIAFKLKLIPNSVAKRKVLKYFFDGWPSDQFQEVCHRFASQIIPTLIRPKRLEILQNHQNQHHQVCLVSASLEEYLKPWCDEMGIPVLATKMKQVDNKFRAEYQHPNCWGPEKATRINEAYSLDSYDETFAYGDSRGDKEMLALADTSKKFD